jgi:diguanylate cyclase (GGDEF)-like protein
MPEPYDQPRSICGHPPRLFWYAVALIAAGVPITAGAVVAVLSSPPSAGTAAGAGIFFALALLAEAKPVPLDEGGGRLVSLAFIFVVSSQILFGWEFGVLTSAVALVLVQAFERTGLLRTFFNASVYTVAAFAASQPSMLLGGAEARADGDYALLTGISFLAGAIFVSLNVVLVCVAMALHERIPARGVITDHIRHSGPVFAIMGFIAALAVALWTVEPPLLLLLAGPLFALALYQRYALRTRVALRAAATDSLTGLKNHRSYEHDIAAAVVQAAESGSKLSLAVLDIDDFKALNDRFGHPEGDRMLVALGELFGELGPAVEGYRLGGDEFALVVDGGEEEALAAVETLRGMLAAQVLPDESRMTISAGIACFPEFAADPHELVRVADLALYWTKRHGKDRCCVYSPTVVEVSWPAALAATAEHAGRLRAAENLIRVVDARDTYTGSHSQSVAVLAEGIAHALGLPEETVRQVRLTGLLHDLGKIAVPDQILQNQGPLTELEYARLKGHSQTGFELLQGLDVAPVDVWILHHHEHWDGSGYPTGLHGEAIPIGSRIVLVADAFDAMTTDRCYRGAMPVEAALAELRRCSGLQFDPAVVAALERSLASPSVPLPVAGERLDVETEAA